jgi:hypothetical protein
VYTVVFEDEQLYNLGVAACYGFFEGSQKFILGNTARVSRRMGEQRFD